MIKAQLPKICHVTSSHSRYDVRIFHKECKSLANSGYKVILLVNDDLKDQNIDGVNIMSTGFKPENRYERLILSIKEIGKRLEKIDAEIYHFHDPELLSIASKYKKIGKKVIFDFHEDVSQQILYKKWIPNILRKTVSNIYKRHQDKKVKSFDAIITVTPKFVEKLKKVNSNTHMITNYPILKENILINDKKENAICFAGGVIEQWGHLEIIKAIEDIDDAKYILAGSGEKEYLNNIRNLKGWNKVEYLGRIPHDEVNKIYERSKIGMTLLSNNTQVGDEGTLGNTKIFEFMSAGLPVICTNNKLWKKIVEENNCGIAVNPKDISQIKGAIKNILIDENKRKIMGENGRKSALEKYNWKTQEDILKRVYKNIL